MYIQRFMDSHNITRKYTVRFAERVLHGKRRRLFAVRTAITSYWHNRTANDETWLVETYRTVRLARRSVVAKKSRLCRPNHRPGRVLLDRPAPRSREDIAWTVPSQVAMTGSCKTFPLDCSGRILKHSIVAAMRQMFD